MSEGVEWALHSCLNLAWVEDDQAVTATKLAAMYELPAAYLNKQLQALVRVGIAESSRGPRGGFRLARSPDRITLMDVVAAIEGPEDAFRCTEIRQQGPLAGSPGTYQQACAIAGAMREAELAWRAKLAGQTLADLKETVEQRLPRLPERTRRWLADAGAGAGA